MKKLDYDIVCSAWQHAEVHKRTGKEVAFFTEHKDRKTSMGANFGYKKDKIGNILKDANGKSIVDPKADVRQLPNGAGY